MRNARDIVLRLLALVGLGASVLLLTEYLAPSHALCTAGGGCDTVRESAYAAILGVPTPVWGALYFTAVLLSTMLTLPRIRLVQVVLGVAGGLVGVGFIVLQAAVVDAWCAYCVVVDATTLLIAAVAITGLRTEPPAPSASEWMLWGALTSIIVAVAIAVPTVKRKEAPGAIAQANLPAFVAAEQSDDLVTIVEFVDFECPACRHQHRILANVLRDYRDRVRIVYKHAPLPQHRNAELAARAALCAGQNTYELANRMFRSPNLSPEAIQQLAAEEGVDLPTFRTCLVSEETSARLQADFEHAQAGEVGALPTMWIGNLRYEGVQPAEEIRAGIEKALAERP